MLDGLSHMLWEFISNNLAGFDSMVEKALNVLTGGAGTGFNVDTVWNYALVVSNSLKPFCSIVIALCLLIEIANVAMKVDTIKFEHGIKLAVKMVLAKVCIDVAPTFLRACYNQSVIWINSILASGGYTPLASKVTGNIQTALESVTGWDSIMGLFASNLGVFLAIRICGLIIQAIAFGRFFEIYIFLAVSPLPCAFLPMGDGAGGGISRITQKFFKTFIAVCLQGVMIVVSITVFNIIMNTTLDALIYRAVVGQGLQGAALVSELGYTMLLGSVVLTVAVGKCGSMAKSIIDAM